ncbi:MAG TPA: radical SAM protein [Phototrophicaceae bacterium]|nr:radical SAM protein [Phototrophicaceae bacterium]
MNIHKVPDTFQKLSLMGDATTFEPAGDTPTAETQPYQSHSLAECISNVSTPTGKKPILKTMITTACEKNCFYCPFRAGRGKMRRVTIKPDEIAGAFDQLQRAKLADGLFLSSGIIKGGVSAQDKIIDTIEIVRRKYAYRGFVHMKLMPGSEYEQVKRAVELADRVSINLEGATAQRLSALAPKKDYTNDILQRLKWAHEIRKTLPPGKRTSIVTQFVVGAVGDTDLELLSVSDQLYRQLKLARVYYSAFHPIIQTPFENLPAVASQREFRLYQASFLLRDYAWDVEDLNFMQTGNLDLATDPKKAWAEAHLRYAPLDVMHATREQLMRIPNVGPKGADAILKARQQGHLTDLGDLRKIGIRAPEQAAPYILFDGRKPPEQLPLF